MSSSTLSKRLKKMTIQVLDLFKGLLVLYCKLFRFIIIVRLWKIEKIMDKITLTPAGATYLEQHFSSTHLPSLVKRSS